MAAPDPAVFEQAARSAQQLASHLQAMSSQINSLGTHVTAAIGGTATGDDKRMLSLASGANDRLRRAVSELHRSVVLARRAAQEAAEAQRAEAEATRKRQQR